MTRAKVMRARVAMATTLRLPRTTTARGRMRGRRREREETAGEEEREEETAGEEEREEETAGVEGIGTVPEPITTQLGLSPETARGGRSSA
jgi:hypothetical protein